MCLNTFLCKIIIYIILYITFYIYNFNIHLCFNHGFQMYYSWPNNPLLWRHCNKTHIERVEIRTEKLHAGRYSFNMINEQNKFSNHINTEMKSAISSHCVFGPHHTIHKLHMLFFTRRRWKARISWSASAGHYQRGSDEGGREDQRGGAGVAPDHSQEVGGLTPRASHWYVTLFTPFNRAAVCWILP